MNQPRRNEPRFYRYPMRRVVAIIADSTNLEATLKDLETAGVAHHPFKRWVIEHHPS